MKERKKYTVSQPAHRHNICRVELVYQQTCLCCVVDVGTTVEQLLLQSRMLTVHPELQDPVFFSQLSWSVWDQPCEADYRILADERLCLLLPLRQNAAAARARRRKVQPGSGRLGRI